MALLQSHPEVAYRSCPECKACMFNHETGEKILKNGKPVARLAGVKLPCEMSVGQPFDVRQRACAKVAPDAGLELSEKNWLAYQHYRRCKAIGEFPDDPIVIENAVVISEVLDAQKEIRQNRMLGLIASRGR